MFCWWFIKVEHALHMLDLTYVELRCSMRRMLCCREGRITEAMQFAQSVMAGLKPGAAHSDSQLRVSHLMSHGPAVTAE